jgi:hypothetical protein
MPGAEQGSLLAAVDQYHAGIVSDDPGATMAQLAEVLGCPAGGGPAVPRLEIVSRQLQPMMERYFATGKVG